MAANESEHDPFAPETEKDLETIISGLQLPERVRRHLLQIAAQAEVRIREVHLNLAHYEQPLPFADTRNVADMLVANVVAFFQKAVEGYLVEAPPVAEFDEHLVGTVRAMVGLVSRWWSIAVKDLTILDQEGHRSRNDHSLETALVEERARSLAAEACTFAAEEYLEPVLPDDLLSSSSECWAEAARELATSNYWHPVRRVEKTLQTKLREVELAAARRYADSVRVGALRPGQNSDQLEKEKRAATRQNFLNGTNLKDLSNHQLAKKLDIDAHSITKYRDGTTKKARVVRQSIAHHLRCDIEKVPE